MEYKTITNLIEDSHEIKLIPTPTDIFLDEDYKRNFLNSPFTKTVDIEIDEGTEEETEITSYLFELKLESSRSYTLSLYSANPGQEFSLYIDDTLVKIINTDESFTEIDIAAFVSKAHIDGDNISRFKIEFANEDPNIDLIKIEKGSNTTPEWTAPIEDSYGYSGTNPGYHISNINRRRVYIPVLVGKINNINLVIKNLSSERVILNYKNALETTKEVVISPYELKYISYDELAAAHATELVLISSDLDLIIGEVKSGVIEQTKIPITSDRYSISMDIKNIGKDPLHIRMNNEVFTLKRDTFMSIKKVGSFSDITFSSRGLVDFIGYNLDIRKSDLIEFKLFGMKQNELGTYDEVFIRDLLIDINEYREQVSTTFLLENSLIVPSKLEIVNLRESSLNNVKLESGSFSSDHSAAPEDFWNNPPDQLVDLLEDEALFIVDTNLSENDVTRSELINVGQDYLSISSVVKNFGNNTVIARYDRGNSVSLRPGQTLKVTGTTESDTIKINFLYKDKLEIFVKKPKVNKVGKSVVNRLFTKVEDASTGAMNDRELLIDGKAIRPNFEYLRTTGNATIDGDLDVKGEIVEAGSRTSRGTSNFAGSGGEVTIAHNLKGMPAAATAFPIDNPDGYLGEVWIRFDAVNLYIGNTGTYEGAMSWTAFGVKQGGD